MEHLSGTSIYSVIGFVKAYHQIPVALVGITKTAIMASFGLFEFLHMPFALRRAALHPQHLSQSAICFQRRR